MKPFYSILDLARKTHTCRNLHHTKFARSLDSQTLYKRKLAPACPLLLDSIYQLHLDVTSYCNKHNDHPNPFHSLHTTL